MIKRIFNRIGDTLVHWFYTALIIFALLFLFLSWLMWPDI